MKLLFHHDLIDTLWNVKYSTYIDYSDGTRFNRYIVECKDLKAAGLNPALSDLIDTLWNVKALSVTNGNGATTGFNRYIVECKEGE